jgi:hypothetical protein
MRLPKNDIPVRIDVPGAVARQLSDFGTSVGELGVEYFSLGAGTDIAPLLEGLEGDMCQSAHWGYILEGRVVVTYAGGAEETCHVGDVFHWPAGHSVRVVEDAEVVLFSPQADHLPVMSHMRSRMGLD